MKINDIYDDVDLMGKVVVLQPGLITLGSSPANRLRKVIELGINSSTLIVQSMASNIIGTSTMSVRRQDVIGWVTDEDAEKFLMWQTLKE